MKLINWVVNKALESLEQAKKMRIQEDKKTVMRDQLLDSENRIKNLKRDLAQEESRCARLREIIR